MTIRKVKSFKFVYLSSGRTSSDSGLLANGVFSLVVVSRPESTWREVYIKIVIMEDR